MGMNRGSGANIRASGANIGGSWVKIRGYGAMV